jgi:putative transposase
MRDYQRLKLHLTKAEERKLRDLLRGGVQQVRVVVRALALLLLSRGDSAPAVAGCLELTAKTVRDVGKRYLDGGLARALYERPRQGAQPILNTSERQKIIAMVCSDPPEGRARWTVRLIAAQAIKRKLVPQVGRETIRILLEGHDLKPWREKNVVRGGTQ